MRVVSLIPHISSQKIKYGLTILSSQLAGLFPFNVLDIAGTKSKHYEDAKLQRYFVNERQYMYPIRRFVV